jgi:hypothetical protein
MAGVEPDLVAFNLIQDFCEVKPKEVLRAIFAPIGEPFRPSEVECLANLIVSDAHERRYRSTEKNDKNKSKLATGVYSEDFTLRAAASSDGDDPPKKPPSAPLRILPRLKRAFRRDASSDGDDPPNKKGSWPFRRAALQQYRGFRSDASSDGDDPPKKPPSAPLRILPRLKRAFRRDASSEGAAQ